MKNNLLKKLEKELKKSFRTEWKHDDILEVLDENFIPFCFFIVEPTKKPHIILLSLSVEMKDAPLAVGLALTAAQHGGVGLAEEFYIDDSNEMFLGEAAHMQYNNKEKKNLFNMTPISKSIN